MSKACALSRRQFLSWASASGLGAGPLLAHAAAPVFVVQNEPSLGHVLSLLKAALQAADFPARFQDAPITTEKRNLYETSQGRIHLSLLPTSAERLDWVRQRRLRMLAIPLERGLLGWRACVVLQQHKDLFAHIQHSGQLQQFVFGQGASWWDSFIFRQAGITVREVQDWRAGEFAQQMESGQMHAFPMGLEELHSFFLPHFQKRHPQLVLDQHLLLHYPWYRFLWVSPHPSADDLYSALQLGFERLVRSGEFLRLWQQLRPALPPSVWQNRKVLRLRNPWFGPEIIPEHFQHLLLAPEAVAP